jgi:hypothetical protein
MTLCPKNCAESDFIYGKWSGANVGFIANIILEIFIVSPGD